MLTWSPMAELHQAAMHHRWPYQMGGPARLIAIHSGCTRMVVAVQARHAAQVAPRNSGVRDQRRCRGHETATHPGKWLRAKVLVQ